MPTLTPPSSKTVAGGPAGWEADLANPSWRHAGLHNDHLDTAGPAA